MKKYSFIIYLSLSFGCAWAQNYVDILKVTANTSVPNKFDSCNSTTRVNEVVADLTVPIKLTENFSLLSGLIYENIEVRLFAESGMKNFGSTTLKLGANKKFSDRWSGTLVMLPKIATDYATVGNKDFQLGAIGFMKFKKREDLVYKFGLYCNSELFGPFFVPMAGVYYLSPNKKFEANVMLPLQADVNYKLHSFVNLGFNFNGQMRSYHLTGNTPETRSSYVAKSTNEFYGYLKFNVSKGFSIQAKAGYSLGRSYRVYGQNDRVNFGLPATFIGGSRKQLNSDFSDGAIFQLVLLYRFHLDKH